MDIQGKVIKIVESEEGELVAYTSAGGIDVPKLAVTMFGKLGVPCADGTYRLPYSSVCQTIAHMLSPDKELIAHITHACRGEFPVAAKVYPNDNDLIVISVDPRTGMYSVTSVFKLGGAWKHSYDHRALDSDGLISVLFNI